MASISTRLFTESIAVRLLNRSRGRPSSSSRAEAGEGLGAIALERGIVSKGRIGRLVSIVKALEAVIGVLDADGLESLQRGIIHANAVSIVSNTTLDLTESLADSGCQIVLAGFFISFAVAHLLPGDNLKHSARESSQREDNVVSEHSCYCSLIGCT